MDLMLDWETEGDRFSFDDSDRFEEDSLCSWISEPESLCNNWRGWRRQPNGLPGNFSTHLANWNDDQYRVVSLVELAAQAVACHIPFEVVEHFYPPIPEQLQLRIAFWSFPENEEDIRLYSCLANGSADEFQKGEHLFKARAVKDALQIGFHLSATVIPPQTIAQAKGAFNVAVVFDRRRVTCCNCTCNSTASWCAHVVALCLYRIHQATSVCLRAPVSESLSRLHRDQLQKFAQYLISELPQQILPTAQRLLDELLSSQQTAINTVCGAPDPTAGPPANEQTTWCLDENTLHENIKKTLVKFCVPSPIVFSDVNYLSSTAPPAAAEWQSLLRPLRGREPEGMWNLLSIIREMFRRNDSNAVPLLEILTEEVLSCEQILLWWFNTKISAFHVTGNSHIRGSGQNSSSSQHAASSLCDEIVTLWRLAALNPALSPIERDDLCTQFKEWHMLTIEKVRKARGSNSSGSSSTIKKGDVEVFTGFKAAIETCQLDWSDYVIVGITYMDRHRPYLRFSLSKAQEHDGRKASRTKIGTSQVSLQLKMPETTTVMHGCRNHHKSQEHQHLYVDSSAAAHNDGAYSSSSEGFCDSDRRDSGRPHDSDSDLGMDMEGLRIGSSTENGSKVFLGVQASNKLPGHSKLPEDWIMTSIQHSVPMNGHISSRGYSRAVRPREADVDPGVADMGDSQDSVCGNTEMAPRQVSFHQDTPPVTCGAISSQVRNGDGHNAHPRTDSSHDRSHALATNIDTVQKAHVSNSSLHRVPGRSPNTDNFSSAADVNENVVTGKQEASTAGAAHEPPTQQAAKAAVDGPVQAAAPVGKGDASESHPSSDEYQVYFYDTKARLPDAPQEKKKKSEEPNYFAGIKKIDSKQEIQFARAEALHAHGHTCEACKLAKQLAEEMLANPPDLTTEPPQQTTKGKKKKVPTATLR